jgi:hypothetical protein
MLQTNDELALILVRRSLPLFCTRPRPSTHASTHKTKQNKSYIILLGRVVANNIIGQKAICRYFGWNQSSTNCIMVVLQQDCLLHSCPLLLLLLLD